MAEKEHWWREESITACPKEDLSLRTQRETITEDLKENPIKRTLIIVKLKDNDINGDPQELRDAQWLLRQKLTLFGFFGNGIW